MTKFTCNYTGSVYEFTQEHDIKGMREHPDYTEVVEEQTPKQETPAKKTAPKSKAE